MDEHDRKIVEHLREALLLLSQRYREELIVFFQDMLRSDNVLLMEELTQQTFLEVFKRLDRYPGKELRYIVYMIANELWQAHERAVGYRKKMTRKDRLSSTECAILFFRDMQGFTFKDIGEMLNIKGNTVQVQYARAAKKLLRLQSAESVKKDA